MKGMILVNFKTYQEGTGEGAIKLVKICQEVSQSSGVRIIPIVQVVDLWHAASHFPKLEIWVQHVDWYPQGKHTGFINLEAVTQAGAKGTLLNHSEHQVPPGTVKQVIKRVKEQKSKRAGEFKVMVCCKTLGQARKLAKLEPDFLAYEPPELIGSREKSVASQKPKVIKKIVSLVSPVPVIVGAGIHSGQDVRISLRMGAKGVLVATDIVLAKSQKRELLELVSGFRKR